MATAEYLDCPTHGTLRLHRKDTWPSRAACPECVAVAPMVQGLDGAPRFEPPLELRKVRRIELGDRARAGSGHQCDGRCLGGKRSCDCKCQGRCHGRGVCSCSGQLTIG